MMLGKVAALGFSMVFSVGCGSELVNKGPSSANPLDAEESDLVFSLNEVRDGMGVGALKVCASLNVSASGHADDMRDRSYLEETSPDGSTVRSRACEASFEAACGT